MHFHGCVVKLQPTSSFSLHLCLTFPSFPHLKPFSSPYDFVELSSSTWLPFSVWFPSTRALHECTRLPEVRRGSGGIARFLRDWEWVAFWAKQCAADRRSRTWNFQDFSLLSFFFPVLLFPLEILWTNAECIAVVILWRKFRFFQLFVCRRWYANV